MRAICAAAGAPFEEIGEVGGASLVVKGHLEVPVAELKAPWSTAIPRLVGEGIHQVALEGH